MKHDEKIALLDETEFWRSFELTRDEINRAIESFYTLLEINNYASENKEIYNVMNKNPSFWNITLYGLQASFFMTLGRIFDDGKECHSIHKFIASCIKHPEHFSYEGLKKRTQNSSENWNDWLDEFMKETYQPTVSDFRAIKNGVSAQRTKFNETYKSIRTSVFAHNITNKPSDVAELFEKTNIADIEEMLCFLHHLQDVIWHLYHNGIKPDLDATKHFDKERIPTNVRQAMDALLCEKTNT